jgi:hypothetical protein
MKSLFPQNCYKKQIFCNLLKGCKYICYIGSENENSSHCRICVHSLLVWIRENEFTYNSSRLFDHKSNKSVISKMTM